MVTHVGSYDIMVGHAILYPLRLQLIFENSHILSPKMANMN
jgi:hypothetical protein